MNIARWPAAILASALVVLGSIVSISPATAADDCDVYTGDLTWGFKESFRSYISGAIANGQWAVADGATYETPNFGFSGATGNYDGGSGEVTFPGSITFTGHDGILNTTVANPTIRFDDPETAYVMLDVSGTTQQGEPVAQQAVKFVRLDLAAATVETADGRVTITDAPAELTADGSAAFGTYEAGEAFDPVTANFVTEAGCADVALPINEDATPPTSQGSPWLVWVIVVAALVAAIGATVLIVRRRASR